jgi:hypothetical protein
MKSEMYLEVSVGEAIDKYCILELKSARIQDSKKIVQIHKEMEALSECRQILSTVDSVYYRMLFYVNEKIWDMTDIVKGMTPENPEFSKISNEIFEFNQKRFRLKKLFNELINSNLQEQKSYSNSHCIIYVKNEETFYSNLAIINYISIQYDTISFKTDTLDINTIKKVYTTANYIYDYKGEAVHINIEDIQLSSDIISIFTFQPIRYTIGGLLGDFIQSMSVVYEKFRETGRKGIVYISENPYPFRFPIQKTYEDLKPIFEIQPYIHSFNIHTNESYDIDGNSWRESPYLGEADWYTIYKNTFGVEWGRHPWLFIPVDSKFSNKIVVSISVNRPPQNISILYEIYNKYKEHMIFVGECQEEYDNFKGLINITIPFVKVDTLYEKMVAIRSAIFFVGNLSAALTVANGCGIPRIALLYDSEGDDTRNKTNIWDNYMAI